MSVASEHVDIIKLGFGTAFVTPNLREKIQAYQSYNVPVYFGGTLFEAFLIRNQFQDFVSICKDYGLTHVEVSDGSITIPHTEKCGYIEKLTQHFTVLSEVGSKDAAHIIPPYKYKRFLPKYPKKKYCGRHLKKDSNFISWNSLAAMLTSEILLQMR